MSTTPIISTIFLAVAIVLLSKAIGSLSNLGSAVHTQLKLVRVFAFLAAALVIVTQWINR